MERKKSIPWYAYLALLLTVLLLSGVFRSEKGALAALDYSNLLGSFGVMGKSPEGMEIQFAKDFQGIGSVGVRSGFLLVLSIAPGILLAFAIIELFMNYRGDEAAEQIFSPVLRPLLGIPGIGVVPLIASLTTTDGGAALTRELYNSGQISYKDNLILSQFQYSSPAVLVNLFPLAAPLVPHFPKELSICLAVIFCMKILQAVAMRIYLKVAYKEELDNGR